MPQEELGTLTGLTRASIANIESGRQRVLLHQILQFAEALRVDLTSLVPTTSEVLEVEDASEHNSKDDYVQRIREANPLKNTVHYEKADGRTSTKRVRNLHATSSARKNNQEAQYSSRQSARKR
jgi:transcriptional regulator with XRE-family HTH domain